jgi:ABC-type cobalamin transport system permease subunit
MTWKVKVVMFLSLVVTSAALAAQTAKVQALYKTARISTGVVAVSCRNGADPTVVGSPVSGVLLVSCGK